MSARDELATILRQNRMPWATNTEHREMEDHQSAVILASGYRKPRTISTIEEVDALPRKAVVMTAFGDALTIYRAPRIPVEHYHFIVADGLTATVLHEGPEQVKE